MTEPANRPFVYLDANPFIYFVEGTDEIAAPIRDLFAVLKSRPRTGATSELTLAEVLPKAHTPMHRRSFFELILWSRMFDVLPVTRDVLIESADYRRAVCQSADDPKPPMPKLPDAIHVVSAIRSGCRAILSNDDRLKLPMGLQAFKPDPRGIAELASLLS